MAVTNILDKKFSAFGKIVHTTEKVEFLSNYNYEECNLKSESKTFKFKGRVFIEKLSGEALINVALSDDKTFVPFYLDLPVMINPDVYFSFMPMTEDFSYCIYYEGQSQDEALGNDFTYTKVKSKQVRCEKLIYNIYRHVHQGIVTRGTNLPFWELLYFVSGNFELKIDGVVYDIKSPSYIFIPPNVTRSIKTGNDELVFSKILFEMDCDEPDKLFMLRKINTNVGIFFNKIIERANSDSPYNDDYILGLIEVIISESLSADLGDQVSDSKYSVTSIRLMNDVALKAERLVNENIFNAELSVEFIANRLFISTSYLYRCSMLKFGVGISEYIHNRKLEMAHELIKGNKYSLSEIANILNFCSQSYFSTRFKKKFGISPLQSIKLNNERELGPKENKK